MILEKNLDFNCPQKLHPLKICTHMVVAMCRMGNILQLTSLKLHMPQAP